ncbi:tyrosine-type recombinase/integrase [Falsiroseomonas sp. E2-1-a20]|uniref:tyrosine-type recombinase/integrase n=1 Tax=Falsiroseomonas sp. E2-1-a20 TaxID=3239300 RepID=UPI003F3E50ED
MPRKVREVSLNNRTARMGLKARAKPYFRLVREGLHLGYYRSAAGRSGTWSARRYVGDQRYETAALGQADDFAHSPADGASILTFDQASKAAAKWADAQANAERAALTAEAAPTVRKAVETYIASRRTRDAKAGADTATRLTHHVLSAPLADVLLTNLTEADLEQWRTRLQRGGRASKPGTAPLSAATLARVLNDLRAALRAAAAKSKLPADVLTTITAGCSRPEGASRPRAKQVLPDADVRKIVEAAAAQDDDFGLLVLVMAATGARMDQVARATVADFQADQRRLMVPVSRKGRGSKAQSHVAVPLPDDVVARLRPLATGRPGHEALLLRWHHRQEPGDKPAGRLPRWVREDRRPWRTPSEMARAWRATVAAAGLPDDLVPYCLRHSSIVRGLRAGLPVRLVGAVHDTSVAMIESHYGAFIVDATEDLLRRAVVAMMPAAAAQVARIATERAPTDSRPNAAAG